MTMMNIKHRQSLLLSDDFYYKKSKVMKKIDSELIHSAFKEAYDSRVARSYCRRYGGVYKNMYGVAYVIARLGHKIGKRESHVFAEIVSFNHAKFYYDIGTEKAFKIALESGDLCINLMKTENFRKKQSIIVAKQFIHARIIRKFGRQKSVDYAIERIKVFNKWNGN